MGQVVDVTEINDDEKECKFLTLSPQLCRLPEISPEVEENVWVRNESQQLEAVVDATDAIHGLFQHVSRLSSDLHSKRSSTTAVEIITTHNIGESRLNGSTSFFDIRVVEYLSTVEDTHSQIKLEKQKFEQRILSARNLTTLHRKISPPPLPLPTQNCMALGWDLAIQLLRATSQCNPEAYLTVLKTVHHSIASLKPMSYVDGTYLASSASTSFNALCDFLCDVVLPNKQQKNLNQTNADISCQSVSVLADLSIVRGSLMYLLSTIHWLLLQPSTTPICLNHVIEKLVGIKEQPMYGVCEASGELYCCGQNSYGELGIGDDIERHQLTLVPFGGWDDIKQVVSGNEILSVLTNSGVVLTAGLNKSGQCGHGHFEERVMMLRPVEALRSHKVKFIAASNGCEHMLAITETGLAYSWGYNDRGQLGHENLTTKIHQPKLIESIRDKKVRFGAVSYHHSAIITEKGELYTFGMNDCGQLGLDTTQHHSTPQHVKALEIYDIKVVSCGLYHTLACTTTGELFTFGKNDYGQLGIGHNRQSKTPSLVVLPPNDPIHFVTCGYYHSLIISVNGKVYSFGRNDYGQLGIGTKVHQNIPQLINMNSNSTKITRAACGCYHTVILSELGSVYVFGRNNKGQLGNRGNSTDALLPVPLKVRPEQNSRRVMDITAGFYTTSLVVERKKENDNASLSDQSYLVTLCGHIDIDRSGEIEGLSNFGSLSTVGVSLFEGKYYYEVEVATSGLIQIGWIDGYFQASSDQGEGVGDHIHSWSYDGNRQRRWNSGSSNYGEKWKSGDIIGCYLDLDAKEMRFYRNGIDLGVAFHQFVINPADVHAGLRPGISLERGEVIRLNLGQQPFLFPPTIDITSRANSATASSSNSSPSTTITAMRKEYKTILDAMTFPPAEVQISKSIDVVTTEDTESGIMPECLDGAARVYIGTKLFLIGGMAPTEDKSKMESSNKVYVYDTVSKQWSKWSNLPIVVRFHQAVAMDATTILVIGGENDTPASRHFDLYKCSIVLNVDHSLPQWELIQSNAVVATAMPCPRAHHIAMKMHTRLDKLVVLYGGKSNEDVVLGDIWYLSLDDFTWFKLPSFSSLEPGPRFGCASAVIGENVFLFGGLDKEDRMRADLWRYNVFNRVWHLCHDDFNQTISQQSSNKYSFPSHSMPVSRIHYGMMSDLGHIYILGGENRKGELLCDFWGFSLSTQVWTKMDLLFDEKITGLSKISLLSEPGMVCALFGNCDSFPIHTVQNNAFVWLSGGRIIRDNVQRWENSIRQVSTTPFAPYPNYGGQSITERPVATRSTHNFGKYTNVINALKQKCTNELIDLQCQNYTMDTACCIFAHLDRLVGKEQLVYDQKLAIQSSRCLYRSLCIDMKESSFKSLYDILRLVSACIIDNHDIQSDIRKSKSPNTQVSFIVEKLYPILVVLKILKLNFFELSVSCLSIEELEFAKDTSQPGGILYDIRQLLFKLSHENTQVQDKLPLDIQTFLHLIQGEAMNTIRCGFAVMFPSLLERVEILTAVIKEKNDAAKVDSQYNPQFVALLVPQFTSSTTLFELVDEKHFNYHDAAAFPTCVSTISTFADTLLEYLWSETIDIVDFVSNTATATDVTSTSTQTIKKLFELEQTYEYKCCCILVRALIIWSSTATVYQQNGWLIAKQICVTLMRYTGQLMDIFASDVSNHSHSRYTSLLLEHCFIGKFVPFLLLNMCGLTTLQPCFASILDDLWKSIETLIQKVHNYFLFTDQLPFVHANVMDEKGNEVKYSDSTHAHHEDGVVERTNHELHDKQNYYTISSVFTKLLSINTIQSTQKLSKYEVFKPFWKYLTQHCTIISTSLKVEMFHIYRVILSAELKDLLRTSQIYFGYSAPNYVNPDKLQLMEYDVDNFSFQFATSELSNHLHFQQDSLADVIPSLSTANISVYPPPAPVVQTPASTKKADACRSSSVSDVDVNGVTGCIPNKWLKDFQKILIWAGSQYATSLVIGNTIFYDQRLLRWIASPLFHGGLDENANLDNKSTSEIEMPQDSRNDMILYQIIANSGAGKKLIDKVRAAVDPDAGAGVGSAVANPKLRATRLKRQDSMERTLEKSGGFEAVDRAVRSAFAVLIKHSNISYMSDPMTRDGMPSEVLVDAWRAALQLRRWIVREQQKLATSVSSSSEEFENSSEELSAALKARQLHLYNQVCEPIINRAGLLLSLAPVPIHESGSSDSPFKILPGISKTPFDFSKQVNMTTTTISPDTPIPIDTEQSIHQLKKLMEIKSMAMIEEEDEIIHNDIFSFIQQPFVPVKDDNLERDATEDVFIIDKEMRQVLNSHRLKATNRLKGLHIFFTLLQCSSTIPSARFHILPALAKSFRRLTGLKIDSASHSKPSAIDSSKLLREDGGSSVEKVHYLNDLELAGRNLSNAICEQYFIVISYLLENATKTLVPIKHEYCSGASKGNLKTSVIEMQKRVQDILLVLDVCSIPYIPSDWKHIQNTKLPTFLVEATSWNSWQQIFQIEDVEDIGYTTESVGIKSNILPIGNGMSQVQFRFGTNVFMDIDLHLVLNKSIDGSNSITKSSMDTTCTGGLTCLDRYVANGRWYWEVIVREYGHHPILIGIANHFVDLNTVDINSKGICGVYLTQDQMDTGFDQTQTIVWPKLQPIAIVLDFNSRSLTFYSNHEIIHSVHIYDKTMSALGMCPVIGIIDGEAQFDIYAGPPNRLSNLKPFTFPAPIVSGGLVLSPFNGNVLCWHGKLKSSNMNISVDGCTVIAGDSAAETPLYETIVTNKTFRNGMLYIEIFVIEASDDGVSLLIDMVDTTSLNSINEVDNYVQHINSASAASRGLLVELDKYGNTTYKSHSVSAMSNYKNNSSISADTQRMIGILLDFNDGRVSVYHKKRDPIVHSYNLAQLKSPYFLALSCKCNGAILYTNFHPVDRPSVPTSAIYPTIKFNNCAQLSSTEKQIGKNLDFSILSCDGGEFTSSHVTSNCLIDDSSVYSSSSCTNINIILKHEHDTPFCVTYATIRGPGAGYTAPLQHAIVFLMSTVPDTEELEQYNDLLPEEFVNLPCAPPDSYIKRDETVPVMYFVLDGNCSQVSKRFIEPIVARYIVVKLIRPASGSNIDVGYIGFSGTFDKENGLCYNDGYFEEEMCQECHRTPIKGICYVDEVDTNTKICAQCYDDNRSDLQHAFIGYINNTTIREDEDQMSSNANMSTNFVCPSRQSWIDKINTLIESNTKLLSIASNTFSGSTTDNSNEANDMSEIILSESFENVEIHACGQNNYGELSLGHCNATSKVENVSLFSGKNIRQLAGGNEMLAVVMTDGSIFTCGLNKSGQCGNGTFEERVVIASPVRALHSINVTKIAAANGCEHIIAITNDGLAYSWGYNDRGQLGLGSTISKSHTPKLIEYLQDKYFIVNAGVSYHHSAVVTRNGELLTFGMNDCGQLGLDHTQHQHTPQLVDALSSQVVINVSCGLYHTSCITASGDLYGTGKNDYGQLGLGHTRSVKVFNLVKISSTDANEDNKFVQVYSGYYHTSITTEKGKLLTFGRNDYGQLGIGSKEHKNSPQVVPLPLGSKVVSAACGCYHTLILLTNGKVMVFGRNNKGQLGAGARTLPSADLPLPMPTVSNEDEIVCIAAGFYSSYVLTGRKVDGQAGGGSNSTVHGKVNSKKESSIDSASANNDINGNNPSCDALFESLMREMDRNSLNEVHSTPLLQLKKSNISKKLPLLRLISGAWSLLRALMYQSVPVRISKQVKKRNITDAARNTTTVLPKNSKSMNEVVQYIIQSLLSNLAQATENVNRNSPMHECYGNNKYMRTSFFNLADASVGLLKFCASPTSPMPPFDTSRHASNPTNYSHANEGTSTVHSELFRNQILSIFLNCGSLSRDISSYISNHSIVLRELLYGMVSNQLASSILSMRLAMILFPFQSVSSINKIYRNMFTNHPAQPSDAQSGNTNNSASSLPSKDSATNDFIRFLLLVVGYPTVCRPTLCKHEIGIECSSSTVCHYFNCSKRININEDDGIRNEINYLVERHHVNSSKACEAVSLLRYLTLYPVWQKGVCAGMSRALAQRDQLESLILNVNSYFAYVASIPEDKLVLQGSHGVTLFGLDDPFPVAQNAANGVNDMAINEKLLELRKKAKESMNQITLLMASICVLGGHTEIIREGGHVIFEDHEMKGRFKNGILNGLLKSNKNQIDGVVTVSEMTESSDVKQNLLSNKEPTISVPIKLLYATERVPAIPVMFEDVYDSVHSLVGLVMDNIAPKRLLNGKYGDADAKVYSTIGSAVLALHHQFVWRTMKALSTLFKQIVELDPQKMDPFLITMLNELISSERFHAVDKQFTIENGESSDPNTQVEEVFALHAKWYSVKEHQMSLYAENTIDSALDAIEKHVMDEVVLKLSNENALSWGIDAIQSPKKKSSTTNTNLFKSKPLQTNSTSDDPTSVNDVPSGVWGILSPIPPISNENEVNVAQFNQTNFHLRSPVVRVGRATDSCDIVINDRSVSGRHFHLRRVRQEGNTEEYYELQDFSKNGTIVNGIRVHGASIRVANNCRISLILSRGGMITYEFLVTPLGIVPPPLQSIQNSVIEPAPAGEPLQQQQAESVVEPCSPAEVQNRGTRSLAMASGTVSADHGRMENIRSRLGPQGLRLITTIGESEVPRALISPNPAVDSPRGASIFAVPSISTFHSPRTPAIGSPVANVSSTLFSQASQLLSPASYQQRESSQLHSESNSLRPPELAVNEALRIALGRESVNREGGRSFMDVLSRTRVLSSTGEIFLNPSKKSATKQEKLNYKDLTNELHAKIKEAGGIMEMEMCENILRLHQGNMDRSLKYAQDYIRADQSNSTSVQHHIASRSLANILGQSVTSCSKALANSGGNIGRALREILFDKNPTREASEKAHEDSKCSNLICSINDGSLSLASQQFDKFACHNVEQFSSSHEIGQENPSYTLFENTISQSQSPRRQSIHQSSNSISPARLSMTDTKRQQKGGAESNALWNANLGYADTKIKQYNWVEIGEEEIITSQMLCANYARKLLLQIIRLNQSENQELDKNAFLEIGNRDTLRQLILYTEPTLNRTEFSNNSNSNYRIQEIVSRVSNEVIVNAELSTLYSNMGHFKNLCALAISIDNSYRFQSPNTNSSTVHEVLAMLLHPSLHDSSMTTTSVESNTDIEGSSKLSSTEGFQPIYENLVADTILHVISKTLSSKSAMVNSDTSIDNGKKLEQTEYPKGPFLISTGLEIVLTATYDRIWGVPSPDPLNKYRHKWRKKQSSSSTSTSATSSRFFNLDGNSHIFNTAGNNRLPFDTGITLWRPILPPSFKTTLKSPDKWFILSDIAKLGNENPTAPVILLQDNEDGLVAKPTGFERIDISGKGLPRNSETSDIEFEKKQLRSVWWPIAPTGYVALGCVAGLKDSPFEPPCVEFYRCVRADLVHSNHNTNYNCIWQGQSPSIHDPALFSKHYSSEGMISNNMKDGRDIALWSMESNYGSFLLANTSAPALEALPPLNSLTLSEDDLVLCSPVTIHTILKFVDAILYTDSIVQYSNEKKKQTLVQSTTSHFSTEHNITGVIQSTCLIPELSSAVFVLIKQVLNDKRYGKSTIAVHLVRALTVMIRQGCPWHDKEGILYCRSRVMFLYQDQEGSLMLSALLQSLVELLLVVDTQLRQDKLKLFQELQIDANTTSLPYTYIVRAPPSAIVVNNRTMFHITQSTKLQMQPKKSTLIENQLQYLVEYEFNDAADTAATEEKEGIELPNEYVNCRFENLIPFQVSMQNSSSIIKSGSIASIIYYEVTIESIKVSGKRTGFILGFGSTDLALDKIALGESPKSYGYVPMLGKLQYTDPLIDIWPWSDQSFALNAGDTYGCGLQLDTHEMFFTKNGRLLGTAFSSLIGDQFLHPVISIDSSCQLQVNLGSSVNVSLPSTVPNISTATASSNIASSSSTISTNSTGVKMTQAIALKFMFQFDSIDWDHPMHGFDWFEQLSQVHDIMASFSSKDINLPNEFLLSADNFLSEISQDVCLQIESKHPYELDCQEDSIKIPLATSIRLHLNPLCETAAFHCLQIIQGSVQDNSSTSANPIESEIRTFSGTCGSQEIRIDGNEFTWRFPVPSNFQSRLDRIRKGPYMKLEARDTKLTLTRDKGWQTAIGVARFETGIHTWEVKITFVTASSNIFLGIARKDVRLDSYLGKDNRGWGWIGNRALWHNGSKQRGTYGEKFKTGDIVRLTLDCKRGTLSYCLNGKDLGIAFGPGGTGPKLEGVFYPGFALYNQKDSIELIGGHRVDDESTTGSLSDFLSDQIPSADQLIAGVANVGLYCSDDEDGDVESSEMVPNYRVELASALSQMGFPMDWCVYALKHCDDDAEQAADFILGNMHAMEAIVREEAEEFNRRIKIREDLISRSMAHTQSMPTLSAVNTSATPRPDTASYDLATMDDAAAAAGGGLDGLDQDVAPSSDSGGITDEAVSGITMSNVPENANTISNVEKWGISFTVVPEYSIAGRHLLALKYKSQLDKVHQDQNKFSIEHDEAIVNLVNILCEKRAEASISCDPLRLQAHELIPSDEDLRSYPVLANVPIDLVQKRFLLLRNFNTRLAGVISFIDFSADDANSTLAKYVRNLRGLIFQSVKLSWWFSVLKEQQTPAAARPEIEIDRHKASECTEHNSVYDSVFGQMFTQLNSLSGSLLRGHDRAFKCQFVGEFGDDFGGLYRESLAQLSSELQSRILPILKPCPNELNKIGENREYFVPNIHLRNETRLVQMAEFLGKLMGIAIRSKTPLDLNLPPMIWKYLAQQKVLRYDVESIHQGCFQVVDTIHNINKHGITSNMFDDLIDAFFTVLSSDKQEVELVPGGRQVRVTWDDKEEYAQAVESYRLNEFKPVCKDISRGLGTIIPVPTLSLLTWKELLTLTCGKATVDIELLRRRTTYGDGCQGTDSHIGYFWEVLTEFSEEQKSSFLRFVWGRSRLPTHAADFTQDFKISGMAKAVGKADSYLPLAHTCFFSIDLPAYSSKTVMKEKLLYAIINCQSIDADNTTVAQRAGQGLNWTRTGES